jgi:hypothetical protein
MNPDPRTRRQRKALCRPPKISTLRVMQAVPTQAHPGAWFSQTVGRGMHLPQGDPSLSQGPTVGGSLSGP